MEIHPVTLSGRFVRLEPLSLEHASGLADIGLEQSIWRYMLYGSMHNTVDIRSWVEDMLKRQARGTDLPFAVRHLESGRLAGATRYLEIRPEHRALEIGGTWYGLDFQRTAVNTESKYLLLSHAFEKLGAVRVQFKTDLRNLPSQKAIERLGAVKEGILRQHMITPEGILRDSVYYSITDKEWPTIKARLDRMLQR
ncbi:MAG: GNAT family protein [Anaerolineales bacterium]|jgi:N-acetyltransferase